MSQIQQDLQSAARQPHRTPRRRLAYVGSALAATAMAAVAAVAVTGGFSGTATSQGTESASGPVTPLSGQQILLVAATTAEKSPDGTGTYWYVKVSGQSNGQPYQSETWTRQDGLSWLRSEKTGGTVQDLASTTDPFRLGGAKVSFAQLQILPTEADALKASIGDLIKHGDVRTSGGKLDAKMQERAVFEGLVSLVSQLPAPQKVRAAAFRAIAEYPNVTNLGLVDGGQGLQISFTDREPARLVIDPASAQVRRANFYVTPQGALVSAPAGGAFTLVSEWTNSLPS